MTKFKVGDRVRLADEDDYRAPYAGTITKVVDPDPGGAEPKYVVREVPGGEPTYERILESALTLDTDPGSLDLDDLKAIVAELVASACDNGRPAGGRFGLHGTSRADRIRSLARISWLANRAVWLESCEMQWEENEAEAELRREAAERLIAEKITSGELIRLSGGRVIEADRYNPAVHGPTVEATA